MGPSTSRQNGCKRKKLVVNLVVAKNTVSQPNTWFYFNKPVHEPYKTRTKPINNPYASMFFSKDRVLPRRTQLFSKTFQLQCPGSRGYVLCIYIYIHTHIYIYIHTIFQHLRFIPSFLSGRLGYNSSSRGLLPSDSKSTRVAANFSFRNGGIDDGDAGN